MRTRKKIKKLTAIDLFSGGGGLSLGLENAGFDVLLGIELNKEISKTYVANHPNAKLLTKDVRQVTGKEILRLVGRKKIDLIAGCPPCQGFSQLTEKWKRKDPRNDLALEMARLIVEIKPTMVMMENVPGIAKKGKPILDKFLAILKKEGYLTNMGVLQMADYGVPQSRRRFVLLAGKGFEIPLPKQTHASNPILKKGLKQWLPISKVIRNMPRAVSLSYANENGGPEKFRWHIVRNLTKLSKKRLKAVKPGQNRSALPIGLRPDCHKEENNGFGNVYGRLRWNAPSVTITSGCTTPCMGRFGHPTNIRTISIREAALIQTFPKSYEFKTQFMDYACDIVGNALPPKFAEIAGESCVNAYENLEEVKNG
jgi:DNA (cytosine-5)-methyltransferase 1